MKIDKTKKILKRIFLVIVAIMVIWCVIFGIYLSNYHKADEDALNAINSPSTGVSTVVEDNTVAFVPEDTIKAGIIFYPGMKIKGEAYALIANKLAANGYLTILVDMPLNVSAFNPNAAISIIKDWPDVKDWYIGGHSLGGQVAQKCALNNPGVFNGVITVARQLDYDFKEIDIPVLGIYGSDDGICTVDKVEKNISRANPNYYTEVMIDGGCHGYFGSYGEQKWDGIPTITREEQQDATVEAILNFLSEIQNNTK